MRILNFYRSNLRVWIKIINVSWSEMWRFCYCFCRTRLRSTLIDNNYRLCYNNSHLISLSFREINSHDNRNYNKRIFSFCFESSCFFFENNSNNKIDFGRRIIKRNKSNNRRDVWRIFNKRWIFVKTT